MNHPLNTRVSLWRVLGSMLYDGVILLGFFLIGNLLITPIYSHFEQMGQPIAQKTQTHITAVICFILISLYYLIQYHRGAQTVGQRAWQFKVTQFNGEPATKGQYFVRYLWSWILPVLYYIGLSHLPNQDGSNYQAFIVLAPFVNLIYCFFNKESHTLHGILSQTRFLNIPKTSKK